MGLWLLAFGLWQPLPQSVIAGAARDLLVTRGYCQ